MKEKDKEDQGENYHVSDYPTIIHDLVMGNELRLPADTPAKKAKLARLKKQVEEAKAKGNIIITPE